MASFQAFQDESGRYRWRLIDTDGRLVTIRPGRIAGVRLTGARRRRVEAALEAVLKDMADADAAGARS